MAGRMVPVDTAICGRDVASASAIEIASLRGDLDTIEYIGLDFERIGLRTWVGAAGQLDGVAAWRCDAGKIALPCDVP